MKIPTIKKANKEFDKRFTIAGAYLLEEFEGLDQDMLRVGAIKQFYQDEILKILGYLDMEDKEAKGDISSTIGCALDVGMLAGWNRAVKELKSKIERIKK